MKITDRFELTHKCSNNVKGQEFTFEELHNFASGLITELYTNHGCTIQITENQINCIKSIYTVQESNICFIVRPKLPNTNKRESEEVTYLLDFAQENQFTPRVVEVLFWDYNSCGLNALKGSMYSVQFSIFPILHTQDIEFSDESEESLLISFLNSWKELNIEFIANKLHPYFQYSSDWVFDIIPSKNEFLTYLNGKFNTLINSKINPQVEITKINGKNLIVFNQNDELAYLEISCKNGLIMYANLMKDYKNDR